MKPTSMHRMRPQRCSLKRKRATELSAAYTISDARSGLSHTPFPSPYRVRHQCVEQRFPRLRDCYREPAKQDACRINSFKFHESRRGPLRQSGSLQAPIRIPTLPSVPTPTPSASAPWTCPGIRRPALLASAHPSQQAADRHLPEPPNSRLLPLVCCRGTGRGARVDTRQALSTE